MMEYLDFYYKRLPVGNNPCVVNRISWIFEDEFNDYKPSISNDFNYGILKAGVKYSPALFKAIQTIYNDYKIRSAEFMKKASGKAVRCLSIQF